MGNDLRLGILFSVGKMKHFWLKTILFVPQRASEPCSVIGGPGSVTGPQTMLIRLFCISSSFQPLCSRGGCREGVLTVRSFHLKFFNQSMSHTFSSYYRFPVGTLLLSFTSSQIICWLVTLSHCSWLLFLGCTFPSQSPTQKQNDHSYFFEDSRPTAKAEWETSSCLPWYWYGNALWHSPKSQRNGREIHPKSPNLNRQINRVLWLGDWWPVPWQPLEALTVHRNLILTVRTLWALLSCTCRHRVQSCLLMALIGLTFSRKKIPLSVHLSLHKKS